MFGSVVLDIAIGMSFVYLLMSLIASVIQEMIAAYLQLRPANLLRGVRSLFSGDTWNGQELVESLYDHGLIRGLYSDPEHDEVSATTKVPAADLQARIRKLLGSQQGLLRGLMRSLVRVPVSAPLEKVQNQALLPAYIPSRTFAIAMVDILNVNGAVSPYLMHSITQGLAASKQSDKGNKAMEAIYALALNSKGDVEQFKKNLENWYNDSMDRASGWYKRYVQRILVFLGLLLAVFFNVDSVRVGRTLWLDRDTRQAMVNAADAYMKNPANQTPQKGSAGTSTREELKKKLQDSADAFKDVTDGALLPVGWKRTPMEYLSRLRADHSPAMVWRCVVVLLGWLITGMAISLGAAFWFDTLNKFMVVRSTVKPQEKSRNEGSKD